MTEAKIKKAVRERAKGRCERCGMTDEECLDLTGRRCHVHRKVEGPYTLDGCELLCMKCHRIAHGAKEHAATYQKLPSRPPTKQVCLYLSQETLDDLDIIAEWLHFTTGTKPTRTRALIYAIRTAFESEVPKDQRVASREKFRKILAKKQKPA